MWAWSELRFENNQCYQQMISAVVGIYYYTFTDDHLCQISDDESSHEQKIIMNDDTFVCNIQLVATQPIC